MNTPLIGSVVGLLLIVLGVGGFIDGGMAHQTALIPALIGLAILIASIAGFKESRLKHAMHAAAVFGVLGILAAIGRIIPQVLRGEFELDLKGLSLVALAVICGGWTLVCVKSFTDAREARDA
jgi:hypothetical protein